VKGKELQVGGPPPQIRLAGALVGLQGLVGVGVAVAILVRALAADALSGALLGEIGFFLLIGGAVLAVGAGLLRGRRWARSPAIVTELLLLPVVYSLLGPSRQLLLGVLAGVCVLGTFLLLISERSRIWSMDLDPEQGAPEQDVQPPSTGGP
jgi:hypothetical protein